jgi:superfamily II DNA helicase RecQ
MQTARNFKCPDKDSTQEVSVPSFEYYNDFRGDALDNAFEIRFFPTQVAVFTAPNPDPVCKYLKDQFELDNPVVISTSIHRPELKLVIDSSPKTGRAALRLVENIIVTELATTEWKANEDHRYIIFVTSITEGRFLAEELDLPFYHAHTKDNPISDEERQERYQH